MQRLFDEATPSGSSVDEVQSCNIALPRESDAVSRIASSQIGRRLSATSTFDEKNDPRLDPNKPEFNYLLWSQQALRAMGRSGITPPSQGLAFGNLCVSGAGTAFRQKETLASMFSVPFRRAVQLLFHSKAHLQRRRILNGFDGLLKSGELLLVLGRPGSGCSTFLKTICRYLGGLTLEPNSDILYEGMKLEEMIKNFRGEVLYNQEIDTHFAHLTVGETLSFAASARAPRKRADKITRNEYITLMVDVVLAVFSLSHTSDTKVGDNFVRGRKRVSIAETLLSRCRVGAWDNSTRGLDAATALQFVKALRLASDINESCHVVAAYQASQSMYDLFDKLIVLYEGYEIYFGLSRDACCYFENMGWERSQGQVAPDFLTAITNQAERKARPEIEYAVPRTVREFAEYWKQSAEYKKLQQDMLMRKRLRNTCCTGY